MGIPIGLVVACLEEHIVSHVGVPSGGEPVAAGLKSETRR